MVRSDEIVAFSTVKKSFVPHPAVFECDPENYSIRIQSISIP